MFRGLNRVFWFCFVFFNNILASRWHFEALSCILNFSQLHFVSFDKCAKFGENLSILSGSKWGLSFPMPVSLHCLSGHKKYCTK